MLFSEEHLLGCYIQLRNFFEEKSHFISHHLLRQKINQEYEKTKQKPPLMFAQKGLIRVLRGGALLGGVMAMSR